MAYDHDTTRDLKRLVPMLIANLFVATLVTATVTAKAPPCLDTRGHPMPCSLDHTGVIFIGIWFGTLWVQTVAQVGFLIAIFLVQLLPLSVRLPILLGSSASVGAALLWNQSAFVGAVAGLVLLTGWLYAFRDQIA